MVPHKHLYVSCSLNACSVDHKSRLLLCSSGRAYIFGFLDGPLGDNWGRQLSPSHPQGSIPGLPRCDGTNNPLTNFAVCSVIFFLLLDIPGVGWYYVATATVKNRDNRILVSVRDDRQRPVSLLFTLQKKQRGCRTYCVDTRRILRGKTHYYLATRYPQSLCTGASTQANLRRRRAKACMKRRGSSTRPGSKEGCADQPEVHKY